MSAIDEFLSRYRREYDFFDQAARLVAQRLESELQSSGIRAIVTSRPKGIARLEQKVRQRNNQRHYRTVEQIYDDIVDLAGVRVALYFPGERDEIEKVIRKRFHLVAEPKVFPTQATPSYEKRFSGYWATHYRVRLQPSDLPDTDQRYADARVEVQVASVLMHAWSEVEHDLVYKPTQGRLSSDEYAILDLLNGMVLSGEVALERLQRAAEARIARRDERFASHYDLAAYLLDSANSLLSGKQVESGLGRVDILFEFLKRIGLDTPGRIAPCIAQLHSDIESRPIADQIADQLLSADDSRYASFSSARAHVEATRADVPGGMGLAEDRSEPVGTFLRSWVLLERVVREVKKVLRVEENAPFMLAVRRIAELHVWDADTVTAVQRIRALRNDIVHGAKVPSLNSVTDADAQLRDILLQLSKSEHDGVRGVTQRVVNEMDRQTPVAQ